MNVPATIVFTHWGTYAADDTGMHAYEHPCTPVQIVTRHPGHGPPVRIPGYLYRIPLVCIQLYAYPGTQVLGVPPVPRSSSTPYKCTMVCCTVLKRLCLSYDVTNHMYDDVYHDCPLLHPLCSLYQRQHILY